MIKEAIENLTSFHPVKKFSNLFLLDKISQKKKDNIRSSYGKDMKPDEEILLILDDTVFGKADNGFAITEKGVYFHLTEPTGFKRRQDKISIDFILDPDLAGLKIEAETEKSSSPQYLVFNGLRMGKYILSNKIEASFLNDLFEAFIKLKQEGIDVKEKGKVSKKATKAGPNNAKISPDSKFIYLQSGDQYFGEVIGEKMNGYGIYYYTTSDNRIRYEGYWINGTFDGHGILTWRNGHRYEGEWKNDQMTGKGKCTWPDGEIYDGEWKDGKRNGKGIDNYSDGSKYDGDFIDDKKHGEGIYIFKDGRRYEGDWLENKKVGKGIFIWPNGEKYDGEWLNDLRKNGMMYYLDGTKYEGEWQGQQRSGHGTLYDKTGKIIYRGTWDLDIFIGSFEGTLTDENGTYTGRIDNQKKNGKGILKYSKRKDGLTKFEGEWKNDKTIQGTYFFEDGATISGTFSDDYSSGKGIISQQDGVKFEGSWENLQLSPVIDPHVRLFMIPDLNSVIFAQEFIKDEFQGKFIFETQQIGDTLNIKSIDHDLDNLLKDEQCDKALQTIEGVRKKINQQQETDDKIHSHLNMREDAVKELKNEILHRDIMAKFGGSIDPKPEIPKQEKPKDDFDDFA